VLTQLEDAVVVRAAGTESFMSPATDRIVV
jgi:hypothetical protein